MKKTPRDDRGRKAAELSPTMLRQVRGGGGFNEPDVPGQPNLPPPPPDVDGVGH
jgi:hypothetical protein